MVKKTLNNKRYFLYSNLSNELKPWYRKMLYRFLFKLNFEYCGFAGWYDSLFSSDIELKCDREIIICEVGYQIAAISILKDQPYEKKICTLRVAKQYRNNGIGHELMELSFDVLNSESPMITLNKNKHSQFESLLNYYNFKLEQVERHYYNILSTELVYNGHLPKKDMELNGAYFIEKHIRNGMILTEFYDLDTYMRRYYGFIRIPVVNERSFLM